MRKNQEPFKRQQRDGWQRDGRWQDQQASTQQEPKKGVAVPEGAGKAGKTQQSPPKKAQANMLRTCQKTSDSDEELDHERVYFVRALVDWPAEPIKSEQIKSESVANHIAATSITKAIAAKEKAEHIKCVVAIVEAGNYQVAPFGGLPSCSRILWRANGSMITAHHAWRDQVRAGGG